MISKLFIANGYLKKVINDLTICKRSSVTENDTRVFNLIFNNISSSYEEYEEAESEPRIEQNKRILSIINNGGLYKYSKFMIANMAINMMDSEQAKKFENNDNLYIAAIDKQTLTECRLAMKRNVKKYKETQNEKYLQENERIRKYLNKSMTPGGRFRNINKSFEKYRKIVNRVICKYYGKT